MTARVTRTRAKHGKFSKAADAQAPASVESNHNAGQEVRPAPSAEVRPNRVYPFKTDTKILDDGVREVAGVRGLKAPERDVRVDAVALELEGFVRLPSQYVAIDLNPQSARAFAAALYRLAQRIEERNAK